MKYQDPASFRQALEQRLKDRADGDGMPGEHGHVVLRDEGLEEPRRHGVGAARRLQRRLHQEHAAHGVSNRAVTSASSESPRVTA